MGCIFDEPLKPYICEADWNCKDCPNWVKSEDKYKSERQAMEMLIDEDIANKVIEKLPSVTPLSEHEKFILSQVANSNAKTIEEIGLMYQKQLAEICQQQNFYLNR